MSRTRLTLLALALCAAPAAAQQSEWAKLPRMQLERQYAGPLQDTVVQRWRDPADGTVCYIYLPITAQHSPPTASGFVQYGANVIGSISCMEPVAAPATAQAQPSPTRRGAGPTAPTRPTPPAVPHPAPHQSAPHPE